MNDWMLMVVPVSQSDDYPRDDGRSRRNGHDGQPKGLEKGGQEQQNDRDRHRQPDGKAGKNLPHRHDLAADIDAHSRRRCSRACQGPGDPAGDPSQILARDAA